ncbi:MAG: SLBB domain-containing protein [Armatimonadota bacterium]
MCKELYKDNRMKYHAIKILVYSVISGILLIGSYAYAQNTGAYCLAPEDTITVTVLGHPDFSGKYFIPSDGVIILPAAGTVNANGKTVDALTDEITEKLKGRFKKPEVTVSLNMPRMQRIYVVGSVNKSGSYDMKPGWRITEVLSSAGGIATGISIEDCKVIILRSATGEKETVLLSDVIRGSADANLQIENGDVITIDPGETLPVYVTGKVKNPGLYRIRKDNPGIMSAITMAGGIIEESASNNVKLTHLDGTSEMVNLTSVFLDGKGIPTIKLQSGDLLLVPESISRIAVLGFVGQPGFFNLKDGIKVTLSDALGMAKGMDNKRAGLTKVAVVRTSSGKEQKMVFDLRKFLKKGDMSQNPVIMAGDVIYVPETDKIDFDIITRSMSVIGVILNPLLN